MKFILSVIVFSLYQSLKSKKKNLGREMKGYESLIGNTPLIKLNSLSNLLGCKVYVKV
jgi:threonine dehydratase